MSDGEKGLCDNWLAEIRALRERLEAVLRDDERPECGCRSCVVSRFARSVLSGAGDE